MKKSIVSAAVVTMCTFPFPADAWKCCKISKHDVKKAVQHVAPIIVPGTTIVVKVLEGKNPVDAATEVTAHNLKVIVKPLAVQEKIEQKLQGELRKHLGDDFADAVEIARLPTKIERQLIIHSPDTLKAVVETGDLMVLVAGPLAAAIHQAIEKYKGTASRFLSLSTSFLSTTFPGKHLSKVRYVVDKDITSLPGIINRLKHESSGNHAVAIGQIIVFAQEPDADDIFFWAHEIQHTVQYARMGVEKFAAEYIKDYKSLENEADQVAQAAVPSAIIIAKFLEAELDDDD